MVFTKVIYLVDAPFSRRDYQRLGIQILQKNGFQVEVWDLSPFLYDSKQMVEKELNSLYEYKLFVSPKEVIQAMALAPTLAFFINVMDYSYHTHRFYNALAKRNLHYAELHATAFVGAIKPTMAINFKRLWKLTPQKLWWKLFKAKNGSSPMLVLASTEIAYTNQTKKNVLWIHALDYDLYLRELFNPPRLLEKPIIVFLDQYLPFHPDFADSMFSPPTPVLYYKEMNIFFDWLEQYTGMEVVIAEHPRAVREQHVSFWQGRKIIAGETISLVRNASLVISHASTAVNFAVLFNKPLLFLTTDNMKQSGLESFYQQIPENLDMKFVNISRDFSQFINKDLLFKVSEAGYNRYKHMRIKKEGTPEKLFWEIFADWLTKRNISKDKAV